MIKNSSIYRFISQDEQGFLDICIAYNDTIDFINTHPDFETVFINTGQTKAIGVIDSNSQINRWFQINNMSQFIGFTRKYKTPLTAEELLTNIKKYAKNCKY